MRVILPEGLARRDLRLCFTIDTRKRELRSGRTDGENWVSLLRRKDERKKEKGEKPKRFQAASGN